MSVTIGGIETEDLPVLGAVTDTSYVVGEHAGTGLFSAPALATYVKQSVTQFSTPQQFGAKGDGVADDTAAINAAIAQLNAGTFKTLVFIGYYKVTGSLTPILTQQPAGIVGLAGATILASATGALFTFGTTSTVCQYFHYTGLNVSYQAAPAAGAIAFDHVWATEIRLTNFLALNVNTLARLGTDLTHNAQTTHYSDINGYMHNGGGTSLFQRRYGAGLYLTDVDFYVGSASSAATTPGTYAISQTVGSWDTITVSGCNFEQFDVGMVLGAASTTDHDVLVSNTIFDDCRSGAILIQPFGTGGIVGAVTITGSWLTGSASAGSYAIGIAPAAGCAVLYTQITGCSFPTQAAQAIVVTSTGNTVGLSIVGNQFSTWNTSNAGAAAIALGGGPGTISGTMITGNSFNGAAPATTAIGVAANAGGVIGPNTYAGVTTPFLGSAPTVVITPVVQKGVVSVTTSAAIPPLFTGSVSVTFPRPFLVVPQVMATIEASGVGAVGAGVSSITVLGFTAVAISTASGGAETVHWVATGDA